VQRVYIKDDKDSQLGNRPAVYEERSRSKNSNLIGEKNIFYAPKEQAP